MANALTTMVDRWAAHRAIAAAHDPDRAALAYNGLVDTGNRRQVTKRTTHELYHLPVFRRQTSSATTRDQRRNFTPLAWMIRRHLDNVSAFTPHIKTGVPAVDLAVRECLKWHARPENFDALRRHSRAEAMRQFESVKVIAGDCAFMRCQGLRWQGIEGDRIGLGMGPSMSTGYAVRQWNGRQVLVSEDGLVFEGSIETQTPDGPVIGYAISQRGGLRGEYLTFDRIVSPDNFIFDAYWPERFDAFRGVSPILTALNLCADTNEQIEYMGLKVKLGALFGWMFNREGEDEIANDIQPFQTPATGAALLNQVNGSTTTTEKQSYASVIQRALQMKGPVVFDGDPGDKMSKIQDDSPTHEFVPFVSDVELRIIFLALDIPYTMYDSKGSSFSAREADRNEYDEACEWKRAKNQAVLDRIYDASAFETFAGLDQFGLGRALRAAKIDPAEIAGMLKWFPNGRAQPTLEELKSGMIALAMGQTSPQRLCARYGDDAGEIADEIEAYLKDNKARIPLFWAAPGQATIQQIMTPGETAVQAPKVKE